MVVERTLVEQSGDSFTRSLKITDKSGNDIDITGWTFVLTLKEQRSDDDAEAIYQDTVTSHTNATAGETELEIPKSETETLFGDYWYDIKFKNNAGEVDSVLAGVFRIEDSITDSL